MSDSSSSFGERLAKMSIPRSGPPVIVGFSLDLSSLTPNSKLRVFCLLHIEASASIELRAPEFRPPHEE